MHDMHVEEREQIAEAMAEFLAGGGRITPAQPPERVIQNSDLAAYHKRKRTAEKRQALINRAKAMRKAGMRNHEIAEHMKLSYRYIAKLLAHH